ncbi:MAG: TRAP transporter large permease [Candidatus Onthomonas sp.]
MEQFIIATVLLIALILIGVPIAFSIGSTTIVYILMTDPANLVSIPSRMFSSINSFTLMALPLFMLAADIMVRTGISNRIFDFVRISRFGKARGGLAYVNILASTIFGSISGAALSDIAGLGYVEMKAMEEDGYDKSFAAAVTASSSCESPLIPPSNVAILYAGTMSLSVGAVLWAGLLPGLLMAGAQMLYVAVNAKRLNLPKHEKQYTKEEKREIRKEGIVALVMPLIILVGITAGWFTPTESAAVAVLYALLVGVVLFHNITWKALKESLWTSAKTTANLFMITSFSGVFAWAIGNEQVPQQIADAILSVTDSKIFVLLIMNVILLIAGMWMETSAAVLLFAPILAPIAVAAGVNPIHFAIICVLNLTIGLITPPVGVVLYATAGVANLRFGEVVKATIPFIILAFVVLALVTYCPAISLALPKLMGFL